MSDDSLKTICLAVVACGVMAVAPMHAEDRLSYNRDVLPILSESCFHCHGFDPNTRDAELRLDQFADATKDRGGYAAIVPGDPDASEIIVRMTEPIASARMPPPHENKPLTDEQIAVIKRWIKQGAEYEDHWAFNAPVRPELPDVKQSGWPRHDVDRFILAELEKQGLSPSPEADRRTLIRRVSFDLTGLPPTPDEVAAFVNDPRPDAYERVVDRLLASPRYGEHMTRYWLDLARYADSHGYQYDLIRTMWPWREWVIQAFNDNMPFDQFTVEQVAGDLIDDATDIQRLASAFNRNHPITIEGGIINEEYRTEYAIDRVNTTAAVWLGLTVGCARCHDHKYDPISAVDFYQLKALFDRVPDVGQGNRNQFAPTMAVTPPMQRRNKRELEAGIDSRIADIGPDIRRTWEQRLAAAASWRTVPVTSINAAHGSTFQQLDDGSTLVTKPSDNRETYTIVLRTDHPVRAIQLHALRHDSLPHGGPGHARNANFVLNRFEVRVRPIGSSAEPTPVKITSVEADYAQANYPAANAIDGKDATGWGVHHDNRADRRATFALARSVEADSELHIRIVHHFGASHQIGRLRFAMSENVAAWPAPVLAAAAKPQDQRSVAEQRLLDAHYLADRGEETAQHVALRYLRHDEDASAKVNVMVMADASSRTPTYVLTRGAYDQPDRNQQVQPGVPSHLPAMPDDAPRNRLGFAQWLVSRDNPLTARVTVNRLWQNVFGFGIVRTSEDLGTQGEWPSHPELLDYLAVTFMDSGWDVKHMMRLIVTSAAYRQSSSADTEPWQRDPENRLLARGPRLRLDAEAVRDNALAIAGLLSDRMGGPSVYPYHPEGLWLEVNNRQGFMEEYVQSEGEDLYRRSMYTYWKRAVSPPPMQIFDAPSREFCVSRRARTNTPLQALVVMNDPQFVEAARFFAERIMREGGDTFDSRIDHAYRLALARESASHERATLRERFQQQLAYYRADLDAAKRLLSVGDGERDSTLDVAEHAAWTIVARIILNLDETITRG